MVVYANAVTNLCYVWVSHHQRWDPHSLPDTAVPGEVIRTMIFTTPRVLTVSFVVRLSWWQGAAPEPCSLKRLAGSRWKQAYVYQQAGRLGWTAQRRGTGKCLGVEGEEAEAR